MSLRNVQQLCYSDAQFRKLGLYAPVQAWAVLLLYLKPVSLIFSFVISEPQCLHLQNNNNNHGNFIGLL